jgi:hypothetical protein
MIVNLFRRIIGYKWEWEEYHRITWNDGVDIFFICKKTGRMKKVWIGA